MTTKLKRFYLAASYHERDRAARLAADIEEACHDWVCAVTPRSAGAIRNFNDVSRAQALLLSIGGQLCPDKCVELGIALALDKHLLCFDASEDSKVTRRSSVFLLEPEVVWHPEGDPVQVAADFLNNLRYPRIAIAHRETNLV